MDNTVPMLSIVFMILALAVSIALPVGLCIYFYKKKRADLLPFFIGIAVMVLFAFILEGFINRTVIGSQTGAKIQENVWLYALYGGIMAGLFEETGRFLAFKTVLRSKRDNNANALMYGAGHGGIEAFAILGMASINNLIYSVLINSGSTAMLTGSLPENLLSQVEDAIQTLVTTPSVMFLFGSVERILAVALHIALSVLVWFAAKNAKRWYLYILAILIHFIVDAGTVVLTGYGVSVGLVELYIAAIVVVVILFARTVWKKEAV